MLVATRFDHFRVPLTFKSHNGSLPTRAYIHAQVAGVGRTLACQSVKSSNNTLTCLCQRNRRSRLPTVTARAELGKGANSNSADDEGYLQLPATASTYYPYSAQLLLAMARLGHLERYRDEVQMMYEPGMPVDLTRCGLLISNIFSPQLDHRPYFECLEQLLASVMLLAMQNACGAAAASGDSSCDEFEGLDLNTPQHLLHAIRAINTVLFDQERLGVNAADPYDPLNGSLADVMDSRKGNQWSLALIYLHVSSGLGLPCALVGSPERTFIRVGEPPAVQPSHPLADSHVSTNPPATFLVDLTQAGAVYAYPTAPHAAAAALKPAASLDFSSSSSLMNDDWNRSLHTFLQQHKQQQQPQQPGHDDGGHQSGEAQTGELSSSSSRDDEFACETNGEDDCSSWTELDAYSADDAATRNSWKALYGPGALTEWGGSVSCSRSSSRSSSRNYQPTNSSLLGLSNTVSSNDVHSAGGPDVVAADGGFGVLESPFAAAAAKNFPEAAGGSGDSADSLNTSCSSSMDVEGDSSHSHSSAARGSCGDAAQAADQAGVLQLSHDDLPAVGLQPVSKRMLLQQLLGGMKLSLMMSGREEELIMVLKYLRATDPFSLPDLRDLALCLAQQRPEEAAVLLREYLAVAPGAPDADMVAEVLAQVHIRLQLSRSKGWQ